MDYNHSVYNYVDKSFNCRIYPTKIQREFLEKQFIACSDVYNFYRNLLLECYINNSDLKTKDIRNSLTKFKIDKRISGVTLYDDVVNAPLQEEFVFINNAFKKFKDFRDYIIKDEEKYIEFRNQHLDKSDEEFSILYKKSDRKKVGKLYTDRYKYVNKAYYRVNDKETPLEEREYILADWKYYPKVNDIKNNCRCKFTNTTSDFDPINNRILISIKRLNIGTIKAKMPDNIPLRDECVFNNITFTKTSTGKYYASICLSKVAVKKIELTGDVVGIDWGIKTFATLDTGRKEDGVFDTIKLYKKISKLQKRKSKCTIGSRMYNKLELDISRIHEHIVNKRNDFQHKLSKELITKYDDIMVESLTIKGLIKQTDNTDEYIKYLKDKTYQPVYRRRKLLSKAIHRSSWASFVVKLNYKSSHYKGNSEIVQKYKMGVAIEKVNYISRIHELRNTKDFASSKLCNVCNYKNDNLTLKDREWVCPVCGTNHDRDINAAINLKKEGIKRFMNNTN